MKKPFLTFLEHLNTNLNKDLMNCIKNGFDSFLEAHSGLYRHLDDVVNKLDLEAKNWPSDVKKEIYEEIDHGVFGRESLNFKNSFEHYKKPKVFENLVILNMKFEGPTVLNLSLDDLDNESKNQLISRIKLLKDSGGMEIKGIPLDDERHATQKELIEKSGGINDKPVILQINEKEGKYTIREGYHRTIQIVKMRGKDNFKLNAYIGKKSTKSTKEKILSFFNKMVRNK